MFSALRAITRATALRWVGVMASAIVITACGNSGSDNSGGGTTPPPTGTTYTIGGTITGLTGAGLILSNNGTTLPVGANANTFTFTSGLATGTSYNVMVQSAPAGLLCTVAYGSGTIGTSIVTNIAVTCTAQNHSLGGTISGLNATGLVLTNNGASVTVNSGATQFAFPTLIATGTPYSVAVQSAPAGYTCTVANGTGTMGTADVSNVVVTCSTQSYTVGGTLNGYTSSGLILANGTDRIAPATGATSFTMPTPVASTSSYTITIATQPTGMNCSLQNGSGTVTTANVTNVAITCSDQSYTLGGTVSGLTVAGLELANNGGDTVTLAANAAGFTFPTPVAFGASYSVTVAAQPTGLTCAVTGGGTGTMPGNNVNNVGVACVPATVPTYTLSGSVSGLPVAGLVLADGSGTDTVTVAANATTFVFPTAFLAGATYTVTVSTQPNGYTCTVSGGSGTMPAANVNSVQVTCSINSYTLSGTISGLTQNGLVLSDGTDSVTVAANAISFSMPTAVAFGSTYTVTAPSEPVGFVCTLTNYTGTMPASNVTNVQVACVERMWVWVGGSDTVGAAGVYSGSAQTPGARLGQATWTDSAGHFWMFGGTEVDGTGTPGSLNDVWEFDPASQQWTFITGTQGAAGQASVNGNPGGRLGSVVWTDGAGNVWMFGGLYVDQNGGVPLNDLWKFNMTSGVWTQVAGGPGVTYGQLNMFAAGNWPPARAEATTWTDANGKLWMFGGSADLSTTDYNDLWVFDPALGAQGEWAWWGGSNAPNDPGIYPSAPGTQSTGNIPAARYGSAAWTDAHGRVWLFGGGAISATPGLSDALSDLWVYDPSASGNPWTWMGGPSAVNTPGTYGVQGMPATNNLPGARGGSATWTDAAGNFWLFGGQGLGSDSTADFLNDLWMFNPTTQQWAWVNGPAVANEDPGNYGNQGVPSTSNQPGSRLSASGWVDGSGNLWLFGGSDFNGTAGGYFNDLWMYQSQ
jgi:Galactose oxidase, central domain